jgi:hypothetical protein
VGAVALAVLGFVVPAHGHGSEPPAGSEPPIVNDRPDHAITGPQGGVGQFAVECGYSHSSNDDPIVHPGHVGLSHRHDFFGNTSTGAGSTYETLLAADTTCEQRLDTASYWAPALLDGTGEPVVPRGSFAYYRAGLGVDPDAVVAYPAGLMMVAGDSTATEPQPTSVVAWSCSAGGGRAATPPACDDGVDLRLLVTFPDCWDGEHLDSDDHRSHVSYSSGGRCDDAHPVSIPQLQFTIDYPPVDDESALSLASGPIESAHADFWNAWDQDKLEREVRVCLNLQKVCSIASYATLGTQPK